MTPIHSLLRRAFFRIEPALAAVVNPLLRTRATRIGRTVLAQKYLRGDGLELGAFASPTMTPYGARTRYVDRVPASHWKDVPEYRHVQPVDPDIIDDGATLAGVPDASQDYIVSFHMLEHVPNTLVAVENWIRVLKPGGILLVAVPDRRFGRDAPRELTTFQHLVDDLRAGESRDDSAHYREIAELVHGLTGSAVDDYVATAPPAEHFHVWDLTSFTRFWLDASDFFNGAFELLEAQRNHGEAIAVLRRV